MCHTCHCIIKMRSMANTEINCVLCLIWICSGMSDGNRTFFACFSDKICTVKGFGSNCYKLNHFAAVLKKLIKFFNRSCPYKCTVLRTFFIIRDKRTLKIYANKLSACFFSCIFPAAFYNIGKWLIIKRHRCSAKGGYTVLCKIRAYFVRWLLWSIGKISAVSAMDMNINKTGKGSESAHIPAILINNSYFLNFTVFNSEISNFFFKNLIIEADIF